MIISIEKLIEIIKKEEHDNFQDIVDLVFYFHYDTTNQIPVVHMIEIIHFQREFYLR